jgi:hypothetical protein
MKLAFLQSATAVVTVACAAVSANVAATAQRTFVASTGVDTNPCTIPAPCRTFAAAVTHASPGGEVVVLDSAGYGTVTITQSVSIIAPPGVYAGISVITPGTDGIIANGINIDVVLRGLTIVGLGGSNGITMIDARSVTVDRCAISSMAGYGIYASATTGRLTLGYSELRGNLVGIASNGAVLDIADSRILDSATGGVDARTGTWLHIGNSEIAGNGAYGVQLAAAFPGPTSKASITRTRIAYNSQFGFGVLASNGGHAEAAIDESVLSDNGTIGLYANADTTGVTQVAGSRLTISGNLAIGVKASAAGLNTKTALSLGSSIVSSNADDGVHAYANDPDSHVTITVVATQVSGHGQSGLTSILPGALILAQGNTITRNGFGISILTGGVILSDGKNVVSDNQGGDVGGSLGTLTLY